MTLKELREKQTKLTADMAEIAGLETLTEEQDAQFEALDAEFKAVTAQITRLEKTEAAQAVIAAPRPSAGQAQALAPASIAEPAPTASPFAGMGTIPSAPEAKQKFECFEECLAAVCNARMGGPVDQRLDFHRGIGGLEAAQRMDTGSKGGFMVPTEFRAELLRVDPAETPLLNAVRTLPPGAAPDAAVELPTLDQGTNQHGGVTVTRIGEGVAKPETSFALGLTGWTPKELAAHIPLTEQLVRNWSGAMGLAQDLLRGGLNAHIENEIFRGAGGKAMRGILSSGAAIKINRTTALDFVFADLTTMASNMIQRGGAKFWLYNQKLLDQLMQMKDGNNNLVWRNNVREGSPQTLWGLPAIPYEFASAVGSLGDVVLVQPDPYYIVKQGSGPFIDLGQINTDFTENVLRVKIFTLNDGGPWLDSPFKLQNDEEVSPFVLLDVPS